MQPRLTIFGWHIDDGGCMCMFHTVAQDIKLKDKTRKNCFRYLKLMSPLHAAICTTISYTLWVECRGKKHYLTSRSKVKVPRRSLWYVTHRLMVMHLHTKYHWPISKDKKVMVWTSFAEKKRKKKWKQKKKSD